MVKITSIICFISISTLLTACFERDKTLKLAPVSAGYAKERANYIVKKGDTLFSIAWKFDKDYKAIAYYNNISVSTKLSVGQKINLVSSSVSSKRIYKIKKKILKSSPKIYQFARKPKISIVWNWPVKGELTKRFLLYKQQKGIDIKGQFGSSIVATKSGVVVYSGNGLRGYGNLVILKHANNYLSAYAFNKNIIVKEGQKVKAKQKIAEMGRRKGRNGLLHFEIRRKGHPVDPLKYLSKH